MLKTGVKPDGDTVGGSMGAVVGNTSKLSDEDQAAMAVYLKRGDLLIPQYVNGDNFRLFSSLKIPIGEGLSGWVAQNSKPILNGNPSVEPGYLNDPTRYSTLRSAVAVPLEGTSSIVAVLALYRAKQDGFSNDDLNVLMAIGAKLGATIEHAVTHPAKDSANAKAAIAGS